jgi:DUF4097 and DUF4098 domain-containing protein YvlB
MYEQNRTFSATGPIDVAIRNESGSVELTTGDSNQIEVTVAPGHGGDRAKQVAEETQVDFDGQHLTVKTPKRHFNHQNLDITVAVPNDSTAAIRTASADISCQGRLAALEVQTASGAIDAQHVTGDANLKSASGDIEVDSVGGAARLGSASGSLRAGTIGEGQLESASGDISVTSVSASLRVNTASGDIEISSLSGPARVDGVSGDVRIGLAAGLAAKLEVSSLTGEIRSELPVDDQAPVEGIPVEVSSHTVSGDITIHRATA